MYACTCTLCTIVFTTYLILVIVHILSQAFVNLTSNIREALFRVLSLTLYTDEGNVVLDNGDEVGQLD